ncbi:flavocytochrome c, partial [Sutterella massiliensis]|nr:flavocytochrome c [Sutterella massiliensis]
YKLLSDAALQQKDGKTFLFFNEPIRVTMRDTREKFKRLLSPMDNGGETDYCVRGDTIKEVAKKAGIDPKQLEATVRRYNAFAAK